MSNISRRSFIAKLSGIASLPLISFPVWFEKYASAQTPMVRYDAWSSQGKAMLSKYSNAVKTMMSKNEGDPRSWTFQWYTHSVKRTATKAAELTRLFTDPTHPNRALAQEMWNTCQAHGSGWSEIKENFFLPWHRMFVYFFERIIRKTINDSSFTLPYWDYSSTDVSRHGIIPPEFRMQGDVTFGSLFVQNRNPGVNQGEPIDQGDPDQLSLNSLNECTYKAIGVKQGFCMNLDFNLHGNVHVLTGDTQNMGDVPWAAKDPIFWLHHCNIDRIWASWNNAGRKNPTDQQYLSQEFIFADENGNRIKVKVQDFLDLTKLEYKYDRLEQATNCPTPQTSPNEIPSILKTQAIVNKEVVLGNEPVQATLAPPGDAPEAFGTLIDRIKSLKPGSRLYLVVKNLRAEIQPGTLYHIYVGNAEATKSNQHAAGYIGSVNFFDAAHQGHDEKEIPKNERFVSFDATEVLKNLQTKGLLSAEPKLTISPSRKKVDSKPVIGEITLVEQSS